nr:uncharacterized protein LOC109741524 [Aegilops tauschii subsp. strangulata]
MPPTTTSTTAPSLPDELLEEVFLRLPPEEPALLARASFASKLWLGLLSGPRFRRRYGEFHGAPPMLGFLYSWPYLCMPDEEEPVANFVSTTKFAARAPDDHGYTPWDCRHGRVLLGNHYKYDMGLVVWDPMTGRRMKLEAPAHHWVAAVLCDVSDCDHRACHEGPFRVVFVGLDRIGHDDDDCVARARVYSPETDEWSEQCPGLQNDGDRKKLPEGPSALQQKAVRAHDAARAAPAGGLLRITEAGEEGLEI